MILVAVDNNSNNKRVYKRLEKSEREMYRVKFPDQVPAVEMALKTSTTRLLTVRVTS